jgi:hypothetical protein
VITRYIARRRRWLGGLAAHGNSWVTAIEVMALWLASGLGQRRNFRSRSANADIVTMSDC